MSPRWDLQNRGYDNAFYGTTPSCKTVNSSTTCAMINWPERHAYGMTTSAQEYYGAPPTYNGWWGSLAQDQADAAGHNYRRNRYYDPVSGRFTQEDPIGLAGGLNVYGFAAGDPVNFTDPFGLCPLPDWLCTAWDRYQAWRSEQIKERDEFWRAHGGKPVELGVPPWMGGPAGEAEAAEQTIAVIGRLRDTKAYVGKVGYEVLNLPRNEWTFAKNMRWVDDIIARRGEVLTVTEQNAQNLWDESRQAWTVYKEELERFFKAGYQQVGNRLVPPSP